MSVLGTFGSFGIARLAIYASSAQLSVTGNNIANINTEGYCRQYLSTSAMYISGTDQLASGGSLNFGSGVSSDAIYQYRDIYMDIRYRDEATRVGEAETWLSGLNDLASVLDEVASGDSGFGVLEAQFSEIVEQLQLLSEMTGSEEYDTLVRSTCETLVSLFNSYADKLETIADNTLDEFMSNIDETNTLLTNIRDMNEQIRNAEIYGDMALTLRDQRNLYIDELSNLIGIDVIYSTEEIGLGLSVEHVTIRIAGTDIELVDGIYCTQLELEETIAMVNPYVSEEGETYFDTDDRRNYMYMDADGNPTNDASQATAWLNPSYPDPDPDNPWLSASGKPVSNALLAGPQLNSLYIWDTSAGTKVENADGSYYYTLPSSTVEPFTEEPMNDEGGWLGGQYAVGEWDPVTEDWVKNADGSYYVAYTTNDPNYGTTMEVQSTDDDGYLVFDLGDGTLYYYDEANNTLYDANGDEETGIDVTTLTPVMEEVDQYTVVQINNNVDGDYDNNYQITLSALTSSKGFYLKDNYNRDITHSVLLDDNTLSGALQAYRELLTEEGEFSSMYDIAVDNDATVKYGIPYYRMAVDALAQKFAETFNTLNNLNPDDIFSINDDGSFMDKNSLLVEDGIVVLDAIGNPIYEPLYASDGETLITVDNMHDVDPNDPDGLTYYESTIYNGGVRAPNYLTDSDGNYLMEDYNDDGELIYVPIPTGETDSVSGDPIYINQSNLTPENLAILESDAISQELYLPEVMFSYDEENDVFLNKNGTTLSYVDSGGNTVAITKEMAMTDPAVFEYLMENGVMTDEYSNLLKAGNLFSNNSNNNDGTGITAANISISRDWSIGEVRIVLAKGEDPGSADNSNVLQFILAMDASTNFKASDIASDAWTGKNEFFSGSFQQMFTNTTSTLAQDQYTTTTLLTNYESQALSLNNSRMSVSGVDLNEEATNMMQYQKSYVAAAKLMTTLDEVLQTLLNM